MQIGVGLPTTVPGVNGFLMNEWARRADQGPFSSLGVLDRLAYDSFDPLATLAAAASVTRRIRLVTMVLAGPIYQTAVLAKQAATVDALSGGRLSLGLALGARESDYQAAGADYRSRGKRFSEQLARLREIWEDSTVGPNAIRPSGPELLVGGSSPPAFARMARYADGYVHSGGPPRAFAKAADQARAAWKEAGRPGRPRLWGQAYYALDGAEEAGARYLRHYYAFTGPFAEKVAAGLLTAPRAITELIEGYEEAGCDELVLLPTVADLGQLDLLAEVLG